MSINNVLILLLFIRAAIFLSLKKEDCKVKLEINIDDNFVRSNLNIRSLSFSRSLDLLNSRATLIRKAKKQRFPTFILDNKLVGYNFASRCGFKVPKILQAGVSIEEIKFVRNSVIKPMYEHSSKGVFVSYDTDNIVYLNKNIRYSTANDAKNHARKMLADQLVKRDLWMVEELLTEAGDLAKDIKFYCFYGKTGLVLQTERVPAIQRCWYDSDLNYVDVGKYSNSLYKGNRDGIEKLQKIAEELSLQVPSPFVRIDFLVCNDEYYIGEFTPSPSGYRKFSNEWDTNLGEIFMNATIELAYDVATGKTFDNYIKTEKTEAAVVKKMNGIK